MEKNELPVRVLLDSALLFRDDVSPVVLRTYVRLHALAWKHHYNHTDRFTTDELLVLLGLSMRPMYSHLAQLRKLGVLKWASDGNYGYIFTFPKSQSVPLPDDASSERDVAGSSKVGAWISSPTAPEPAQMAGPVPSRQPEPSRAGSSGWSTDAQTLTVENSSPAASGLRPEPITAEISSWNSGAQNPTVRNSSPAVKNSSPAAKNSSQKHPVVVDHLYPDQDMNKQQQHRENRGSPAAKFSSPTAKISSPTASGLRPEPITVKTDSRAAARRWRQRVGAQHRSWPELETALTQAGMWHDQAQRLTARLDVDGVLDALGWIAAVRADRRVYNHGAVLVKQLQAGRHAPPKWRPAAVCAGCGVVESRCGCGGRGRLVPAVYYTAAIEPVRAWGCDAWGVCQTCGRVACGGHDPVGEGDVGEAEIYRGASNGRCRAENSWESRIRCGWLEVAEFIRQRYGIEIKPVEIGNYEVKVTFPGDERSAVVNWVRSMLKRKVDTFVEVIDAGPV